MKNVLIIGYTWPESSTTAAGGRMMQLIHFFKEEKYSITFASTAAKSEFSNNLNEIGVTEVQIKLNHTSFDSFVSNLNPNIVLFDRFLTEEQFGWRIAQKIPQAIRILDTEDLHFLRKVRKNILTNGMTDVFENALRANELTKREIASIYRCDLSLIISSYEEQLLQSIFNIPDNLLLHLPFMLEHLDEITVSKWNNFDKRKDFICIGNGKHKPNTDAVLWLYEDIWPIVRKTLPKVNIHIYGAYLPQQIKEKHNPKAGFYVNGWTKDIDTVMQSTKVNVAPLRFGAGIKGKLIDAMQNGTPNVTTPIGAEGMSGYLPWNGKVVNNAIDLAKAMIALYINEDQWQQSQKNGVNIINNYYSKALLRKKLSNKISILQASIDTHRNTNFIGSMLLHHTLTSTKYLSKWIEEKEKNN